MAGDAGNAVLGPIIEKVVTLVVDGIGRQFGYLFYYKRNIKNLAKTAALLENSRIDAENFFEEQRWNNKTPAQTNVGWLDEVKEVIKDAKQIGEDTDKLKGCLNLKGRYVMSRKSTKLAADIQKLKREAPRGIPANTVRPAGSLPGASANKASEGYKTRMQTRDEVMVALEDPAIRFIGLCGMGGVGKTKMVHEVREKARNQKLFDETAMSTVSQNTDLFKIQGDLAEMLGLNALKEVKNVIERADQLRLRLTGGKKVLIILDDVWSNINLEDVGIPVGDEHKECKVLMTSRQENVCRDIQKNIKVHALDKEEGRALFRKTAGEHVEKNNLGEIADEVADECEGLPIALLTLSSALSNKDRRAWEDAVKQLREGQFKGIKGMEQYVYQSIKLSYDFLAKEKLEEAQPLLLLCCQHQEDAEIYLEKLARYCLALDLFAGVTGVVQARNRVYSLVEHLKSCFLLQAVDDGDKDRERVKVHDVVRDVCRFIASKERDSICMHICKKEDDAGIGGTDLDYQKLKLLVDVPFHLTDHLSGIKSFLEQTQELRVLESAQCVWYMRNEYPSLAPQFSTSLRMLSLEHTSVGRGMTSELVRLTGLEVLSFMGSTLFSFPHQIGHLSNLKLLDLRYKYSSETSMMPMPSGILPKLKKLEVLFMGIHYFPEAPYSEGEGEGDVEKESCPGSIEELDWLTNLTTLQVDLLRPTQLLDLKCFRFDNLKGFSFGSVGKSPSFDFEGRSYPLLMKNIRLKEVRMNWILGDKIQSMVRSTVDLSLEDIKDWTYTLIFKHFASLKILKLRGCHQLEHIIHDGSCAAFVNLETLEIKEMRNVRELCHNGHLWMDHTDPLCLVNLKVVNIEKCGALKFIFPHPAAKCLSQLQELSVSACGMLEGIVSKGREGNSTGKGGEITEESNDLLIRFPKLTHVQIYFSPNLRGFYNLDDGRGQSLFNPKVNLCRQVPKGVPIFQNLATLTVDGCHSLAYLIPCSIARMLVNLQELTVKDCKGMKEVISKMNEEEDCGELEKNIVFPSLRQVTLFESENLSSFCSSDQQVFEFPSLEDLEIRNCPEMETFCCQIPRVAPSRMLEENVNKGEASTAAGGGEIDIYCNQAEIKMDASDLAALFPKLRTVFIHNTPNFLGFYNIECYRVLVHLCSQVPKGVPIFQNLETLIVNGCHSLAYLIPCSIARMLVNLKRLYVEDCKGMKEVISKTNEEEDCRELEKNIVFPSLIYISLEKLENLSSFCSSDQQVFEFPSLERLLIRKCPEIETFCCQIPRVAPSRMLEENVNKGEASTAAAGGGGEIYIDCNQAEIKMDPSDLAALFPKLSRVEIQNTPNFRGFYNIERYQVLVPKGVPIFQNLASLTVNGCHSLAYLIPCSIARMLVNLQELNVWSCKGMKEVISKMNEEEEDCGEKNIVFPSLRQVILFGLENLSSFCSSDQQVFEFPSLETLHIGYCPEIETFCCQIPRVAPSRMLEENVNKGEASTAAGGGETHIHCNQAEIKMDPSDLEALFPKLKIVSIRNTPNFRGFYNIERYQVLVNLEVRASYQLKQMVEVGGDNLVSAAASTSRNLLQNLKHIRLKKCESVKTVLDFEGFDVTREEAHAVFSRLETILLHQFSNLEHICRLLPKEVNGFQNLRSLLVYGCDSLSYLLTSTMAHMLLNLKFLIVGNCKSMKEVIKVDEDCGAHKIVFRSLCRVLFVSSEKLSSFCSSEQQEFDFPSLNQLYIGKCPAMTNFCCGHLTAKKLQGVYFNNDFDDESDDGSGFDKQSLFDNIDGNFFRKGDANEIIHHFYARVNQIKTKLKEDGVDEDDEVAGDKPLSKDDLNENARHLNASVSQISCHVREDDVGDKDADDEDDIHVPEEGVNNDQCSNEDTPSKPTKALLVPLIASSPEALLAPADSIISPPPPVSDNNEGLGNSSTTDLGRVASAGLIKFSDTPILSEPSLSTPDDEWKRSRILVQGIYIKSEMETTFEEILAAKPDFLSGVRLKKDAIKTVLVESAIHSFQILCQSSASSISSEQLDYIKDSLHDLVFSGLDVAWLEKGYHRASLVLEEQKAVSAAAELGRLEREEAEDAAAFEMARTKLEVSAARKDAFKAEYVALMQELEVKKEGLGGEFDMDTYLGDGLLN